MRMLREEYDFAYRVETQLCQAPKCFSIYNLYTYGEDYNFIFWLRGRRWDRHHVAGKIIIIFRLFEKVSRG